MGQKEPSPVTHHLVLKLTIADLRILPEKPCVGFIFTKFASDKIKGGMSQIIILPASLRAGESTVCKPEASFSGIDFEGNDEYIRDDDDDNCDENQVTTETPLKQ